MKTSRDAMKRLLGETVPPSTLVFISGLTGRQYKVEIDGWAAR